MQLKYVGSCENSHKDELVLLNGAWITPENALNIEWEKNEQRQAREREKERRREKRILRPFHSSVQVDWFRSGVL